MKDIPTIKVEAENLPAAWEKSVLKTWDDGVSIKTEYDKDNDSLSRDSSMIIVIKSPLSEPRIHRAFPGGLEDLEIYRREVVDGIHDEWINPEEGKWTYTYHQRLFGFKSLIHQKAENSVLKNKKPIENKSSYKGIDQIQYLIDKLAENYYSRRAQAITWDPEFDPNTEDPPCLQRVWCRITKISDSYYLNMNTHWRSRDAYKAAFMNMYAFTDLQRYIAEKISEKIGLNIKLGRYVDISDSYHIYGAYKDEVKSFIKIVNERDFSDRTWDTEFARSFFEQA